VRARYRLASLLWEQDDLLAAWDEVGLYFKEAGRYDLHWERASLLRAQMERAFLWIAVVAACVISVGLGIPGLRLYRRYRGASLAQLMERNPKSFPEIARVLSLVRHEILKHNTAFLRDVGHALELGLPEAEARAIVVGRRMFGERGGQDRGAAVRGDARDRLRAAEQGGIYGRFLGYVEELHQVARKYGERLNLYRKDPIFRPMLQSFEMLAELADGLRNPGRLSDAEKVELGRKLQRAADALGRRAFEELSRLIATLCVVDVDEAFVRSAYDRVRGEAQFAGLVLEPLEVRGTGARVRIFRGDLDDILVNLLRNSLRSTAQHCDPPRGIGVDLVEEVDDVTGLSSLAIRIKDRSSEKLSNEMLRGRYVERGMGITVDLLSRYDGSLGVEAEPGWRKAVVVRFFTLEGAAPAVVPERIAS
jgi:signal transduction histidine kinase